MRWLYFEFLPDDGNGLVSSVHNKVAIIVALEEIKTGLREKTKINITKSE